MKYIFSLMLLAALTGFTYGDGFYQQSFRKMDGPPVDLSVYHGRKILFVILPVSAMDTSITPSELDALGTAYPDSLVIVGIPAEEFGYTNSIKNQVKDLYSNQPSNFILAQSMHVTKSSGQDQHPLFQWLTDIDKNKFFDRDVTAVGQKFFVNSHGQLYAVTGPHVRLSNPIMQRIISRQTAQ
jgi:glutathione peroxidase